uniref:Pentatricopeptide repeat-containing protein n=1 Tax=Kalanchoe fedtschenkoi TaxID=63787 RepID=A0A7N0SZI4_KALFE
MKLRRSHCIFIRRVRSWNFVSPMSNIAPESKTHSVDAHFSSWVSCSGLHTTHSTKCRYETLPNVTSGGFGCLGFNDEGRDGVVSWTSEISKWVKQEKPVKALSVFRSMGRSGVRPNYVTVLSLVKAAGVLNELDLIGGVHVWVVKMGLESESSVITALIGVYSVYDMGCVWRLFDKLENKDVVTWSSMVAVCTKNELFIDALECFWEMQDRGVEPNYVSIVSVLPACANLGALSYGKQVHGFALRRFLCIPANVQNSLVDMYAKCGHLLLAFRVFEGMVSTDLISWKIIIRGCAESGFLDRAIYTFKRMCYSSFAPNENVVLDIIKAVSSGMKDMKIGLMFHDYVIKRGFLAYVTIRTALLQVYGQHGELDSARMLFDHFIERDVIAWNAMISVYAQCGHPFCAFDLYKHMLSVTEIPNEVTFVSLLHACLSLGAQELGESIQARATKAGYMSNTFIRSALIELYCKFGRIGQGKTMFSEVPTRDLICWSSMINGYAMNGCGVEALETFEKMLDCGISPNDVVFISVLFACSHSGLDDEAWFWFDSMQDKFGVSPRLAHYACMVDLLSRQGNVKEAYEFVKCMPVLPDKRIWGAILSGCKSSPESSDIVEKVAKELMALDPKNTSYYVTVFNIYADQGRWADVERLRNLIDEKGLKKSTGCSVLEAGPQLCS